MDVFEHIRNDTLLAELARRLTAPRGAVAAEGLWGSSAPIVAGLVAERLGRPLLIVTAHGDDADDVRDDVEAAIGIAPDLLPALDTASSGTAQQDDDLAAERLRLCMALMQIGRDRPPRILPGTGDCDFATPLRSGEGAEGGSSPEAPSCSLVTSVLALMQPVPSPSAIRQQCFAVQVAQALDPDRICDWLLEHGYQKCDAVEVPGDFARRGGIVDVYSSAHTDPVRIEFFDDRVESLRLFAAGTQRSAASLGAVQIPALRASQADGETASFLSFLPHDTLVALIEPTEIQELGRTYLLRLGERVGIIPVEAVLRRAGDFAQLHLHRFTGVLPDRVPFDVGSLPQFEARDGDRLRGLGELADTCDEVFVLCDNAAEEERLGELLSAGAAGDSPIPLPLGEAVGGGSKSGNGVAATPLRHRIRTAVGVIRRGFRWRRVAYVPHHELFHRYRQRRTLRRVAPSRPIDTFFDLETGDYVVHVLHGIGRFLGLKTLERDGHADEYLAIEFARHAVVHVPISQIHVVQKYIGAARTRPKLSTLGGTGWQRAKERVAEAVTDLAAELLAVQARRESEPGIAYPLDTTWQREFEESFIYSETEDQVRAIAEVKSDMTRPRPMDRLLCGDVGYGKTEVAMRAAFKAVEYGRQVAVLVPTTVLAEQHLQTFRERMAEYPFRIEGLSRFRSPSEQRRLIDAARHQQVDILIGTHRLLSPDVHFADLGLVIIDEEQRFGVEAKERLKRLRETVDVLTLTATPIPRTLHMAMLGLRDISALQTAPIDRRAIVTQVRMWDDALIREAIIRELNRDGQVYFVHNFVRGIEQVANRLRTIVPEARFAVGHGQMSAHELEDVMLRFFRREADVLVSTNIIESGLDVPTANTIFIDRAERFGLADLHQLRGRVGRAQHRAYAYLLLSPRHPVTDQAARRLKAIEHYSDLGAGFQIALRDLEIRGAGNILGPEQSGHIEAVGYEMYCQLLDRAVKQLKKEPLPPDRPVNLDLGISAAIPRAYIRADKQRMEVYKRLTGCRCLPDIDTLRSDLRDAFGPVPDEVETLLRLAEIRVLAQPWGIRWLTIVEPDVIFSIDDLQRVQPLFADGPGSPRMPDPRTIHWRLPKRYLEPRTLLAVLRKQLAQPPVAAQ
ncbi:MAG: transcription-repair coupling factor [Phycisphaerales bacterium]|nr:transcription-repair coupling factor [Phycisphaerales bacterium]